jgi:hypothetical protein
MLRTAPPALPLAFAAVLSAALAAALAPMPLAAQAPCTPPTADTGFAEVAVNVNAGTFNQVLPFDVPIRLCGQATADTTVDVIYAVGCAPPSMSRETCRQLAKQPLTTAPVEIGGSACRNGQVLYGRANPATLDGTTFRAVVPRLQAERAYAFCFRLERPISADEAAIFAVKARATLDTRLGAIHSGDLSAEQSSDLRASLRDDLLELIGSDDEEITSNTLFDPALPQAQVSGQFNQRVRLVLEPQLRIDGVLSGGGGTSYATLQLQLRQALDGVRTSAALQRFVQLLDQAAVSNVNLATLLANEYRDELALARLTDDEAARAALGLDPATTDGQDLAQTTDPVAAAQIADRYQQLSETLSNPDPRQLGLDELIQDALGNGMTAPYVKDLTADERAALTALGQGPIARGAGIAFVLAGQAKTVSGSLTARAKALDDLTATVQLATTAFQLASSTTVGNFQTSQANYISADGGLMMAPEIDELVPYIGTNIYLRPVNKDAPLRSLGTFGQTFSRRFAITLGLTTSSVAETEGNVTLRDNLFGSQSLVLGAGLRITDMIRIGTGALVFREDDPSPLINELSVSATYYFSVSFDLDVASTFRGGFGRIFTTQ